MFCVTELCNNAILDYNIVRAFVLVFFVFKIPLIRVRHVTTNYNILGSCTVCDNQFLSTFRKKVLHPISGKINFVQGQLYSEKTGIESLFEKV